MEAQRGDERGDSLDAAAAPPGLGDFDFGLPDFLDLAGAQSDADFGVASATAVADGGILVFPTAVLIINGEQQDRLPITAIACWRTEASATTFQVEIETSGRDGTFSACLPIGFKAPTVSALEAALGPAENAA